MDSPVPNAKAFPRICRKLTPLNSTDRLLIVFWGLLSLLSLILHDRIEVWPLIFSVNLLAGLAVYLVAFFDQSSRSRVMRWIHDWLPIPW